MDTISQNAIEVDVQVNNGDALDKLASDMGNIKKLAGGGVGDPYKDLKKSASSASDGVSKVASGVNKTADALKSGEGKASSFTSKLKEVKKISFDKLKSGASAFAVKLKEAANISFDKLKSGINSVSGALGTGIKKAASFAAKGIGLAAAGVATLTGLSVKAYGDYEQLKGGVETLFGAGGLEIEGYAESVGKTVDSIRSEYDGLIASQNSVLQNANNAYKTAGLSANDYMETVTSFSASLKQSFDQTPEGIKKAGDAADKAIIAMADNANKMGTPMEAIQNAYQGFAKQNYTMLDNLKLGYGGTKTEMERLLKDAQKISGVKYNINNLADVFSAIDVIQGKLGITGTTAKEAATTIQGSAASMKAAWGNLLTSFVTGGDDFDQCITNMVESAKTFGKNVLPAIGGALNGIGTLIEELAPVIAAEFPALAEQILPPLLKAAGSIVQGIIKALPSIISVLIKEIPGVVKMLVQAVVDAFGDSFPIVKAFGSLIEQCAGGAGKAIPFIIGLILAFKGFSIVQTAAGYVKSFMSPFKSLADKIKGGKMGDDLSKTAKGMNDTGNAASGSSQKLLSSAKAFTLIAVGVLAIAVAFAVLADSAIKLANAGPLAIGVMGGMVVAVAALGFGMMLLLKSLSSMGMSAIQGAAAMAILGGALILVGVGFALLVQSAISLAAAGPLAIGIMVGMVAAVALLAVGAAALGPALTVGAVGFVAFGAAILMVGAGALLAAAGLTLVTSCLPTMVQYGISGATAIVALGAGLMVFAAGAALAGSASIVLGAGLVAAAAGIAAFSVALLAAVAAFVAITAVMIPFSVIVATLAESITAMAAAFSVLAISVPVFAAGITLLPALFLALILPAKSLAKEVPELANGFQTLSTAAIATAAALATINTNLFMVSTGLTMLSMTSVIACQMLIRAFTSGGNKIAAVCAQIVSRTRSCANGIKSAFSSVNLNATGKNIMQGLLNGMESKRGSVIAKAKAIAKAISTEMNAALDIRSPSKITTKTGEFADLGLVVGMQNKLPQVKQTAQRVASSAGLSIDDELRAYSVDNSSTSRVVYGGDTTIAPVFQLEIKGQVSDDDRALGRKVRGWVREEFDDIMESMSRRKSSMQYV